MYKLSQSPRLDKKYMVITPDGKTIHFGARGYSDYTIHKDKIRRERYILRHVKNENWNNYNTPGFWARYLLWNKPTISQSIRDMENRFGIGIITQ